jgi:hypothetical protein
MTTKYIKFQFIVYKILMKKVTFTLHRNMLVSYIIATAGAWWINEIYLYINLNVILDEVSYCVSVHYG